MIPWTELAESDVRPDIRLVVSDMDGTLLDARGKVPERFWPLLDLMGKRGVLFVPASGRQCATLRRMFPVSTGLSFIAENGNTVLHEDRLLTATDLGRDLMLRVIHDVRRTEPSDFDIGLVVCGQRSAYIERCDDAFLDQVSIYYAKLEIVEDLTLVDDDIAKLSVFDFDSAAISAEAVFAEISDTHQVVVAGHNWIDIMDPSVNKGTAVEQLQRAMGITPAQTVVFGDYLNDLEMMGSADFSIAMGNAHPDLQAAARYIGPSNTEDGVLQVIQRLLGRPA